MKRILYFGIFNKEFSRNKVYADGLREHGFTIVYCIDTSRGPIKFLRLFFKLFKLRKSYDTMIVGYPAYIVAPCARIFSLLISIVTFSKQKKIIVDALCSFYESQIISRNAYRGNPFRIPYVRGVDWLLIKSAEKILVETQAQKNYFIHQLGARESQCIVVYTGVDTETFYYDDSVKKNDTFTVLFRGRITKEAGLKYVLEAAQILQNENIKFLIIGFGWGSAVKEFNEMMEDMKLKNVVHIGKQLPVEELRTLMLQCHVSLGQFADNERLKRTIPHKAFESLAMKLPYITARSEGVSEILKDGKTCLMVEKANSSDLAEKILLMKNSSELSDTIRQNSFQLFKDTYIPKELVRPIIENL